MNMLELQEKFIEELLKGVRGAWSRIEIHYEYFEWEGDVFENYISKIYQGAEC
jgi:arginyl-tRNA synthetase